MTTPHDSADVRATRGRRNAIVAMAIALLVALVVFLVRQGPRDDGRAPEPPAPSTASATAQAPPSPPRHVAPRDAASSVPGGAPAPAAVGTGVAVAAAVPGGRTVDVRVVDRDDDAPIAGAAVVSVTELDRRRIEVQGVRGKLGPGSAVTDAEGRCSVGGLESDFHEFQIDAPDHLRRQARWTDGALLVRLDRVRGTGTVTVMVTGPDGLPASGITVTMSESDRKAVTAADGRAVFDLVPAGRRHFGLDLRRTADFGAWMVLEKTLRTFADAEVQPGGHHDLTLGLRRGDSSFEARVVGEDGLQLPGISVLLTLDGDPVLGKRDADGVTRLAGLDSGMLEADVTSDLRTRWRFDAIKLAPGARVSATWKLGSATVRGRVVNPAGTAPHAHPRAIWLSHFSTPGPVQGSSVTDAEGRFELSCVPAGKCVVTATSCPDSACQSRPIELVVPSEAPLVLELIDCGRIAATFAAPDRAALRGAQFELRSTTDGHVSPLSVADAGNIDLLSWYLLPGAYEITVELAGRKRAFPVEVKGSGTFAVELRAP